jgi:hypothetical protein
MEGTAPRTSVRYPVVSTDCARSRPLLASLRTIGLPVGPVVAWGDTAGYTWLRQVIAGGMLLDIPDGRGDLDAGLHVAALRTLGPVFVLAPSTVDPVEVLGAGGLVCVDRNRCVADIAGSVVARLAGRGAAPASPPGDPPSRQPHRFLLEWVLAQGDEFSCHHLRWLLGRAGRPLSLVDVRARLRRVEPALRSHGRSIRQLSPIDNASFVVEPTSSTMDSPLWTKVGELTINPGLPVPSPWSV